MLLVRGVVASIERSDIPRKDKSQEGSPVVGKWYSLTYKIFVRMFGKADLIEISEMQSDEQGAPVVHPELQLALDKQREIECLVSVQPRMFNGSASLNYRILHVKLWEGAENSPDVPKVGIGAKNQEKVA